MWKLWKSTKTAHFYRETFETEDGQQQQITMMHKTEKLPYYCDKQNQYEAIGIPYKQNEFHMYLVLPNEGQSLRNLADVFNYQHVRKIITSSRPTTVDIKMPRMKIRTSDKIKDTLIRLGINQLFDKPDLSNMVDGSNLKVSQISYALEMDVDEKGTDVCSGTTAEYKVHQQQVINDASKQFYVQKPYMFFVYHPPTKSILFHGNVYHVGE